MEKPISIEELNSRLSAAIAAAPGVRNVWVVGETSDLRISGGHCYFELVQKDDAGNTVSKIRANCWANRWRWIYDKFLRGTGAELTSGLKVMMQVTAGYHPAYGMSVNVTDVDPSFTLGDAVRLRNEILARLTTEGVVENNRRLRWPWLANRIAVISAQGAAGYGDFINQLFTNPYRLRFSVELFPAVMQGERTMPSVLQAMESIQARAGEFDGVVIIRGGGSTTDLAAFDNYELARAVALFPLPVVVGIGHERDITVLDYVANMRVKTPTAAAEWLVGRGKRLLDALDNAGNRIMQSVTDRMAGNREQLARMSAELPGIVGGALVWNRQRLDRLTVALTQGGAARIQPQMQRLVLLEGKLEMAAESVLRQQRQRIDSLQELIGALSPEMVLRRGFTVTRTADGRAVRSAADVGAGAEIVTVLADGRIRSSVSSTESKD
ncbi:MAG: exodeoxyribonuclease VII large subunit [Muribaculaceae bacterium]|nr:exodeoxyribonuclease VII large subunit [Muribaculaceae bacterium]